jgi:predicted restriction endonuclease
MIKAKYTFICDFCAVEEEDTITYTINSSMHIVPQPTNYNFVVFGHHQICLNCTAIAREALTKHLAGRA